MSITSPSVDQSSTMRQAPTQAALGSGAVGGHHHHHGGGGSEFATLLADLTDPTETDPTAGADSSILTASSANSGATGPGSADPSAVSSLLSELDVNSTTL
jgi:hypothetical protein